MSYNQAIAAETEADLLTGKIIGAAIEVHRNLGPGLLESVYEVCLAYELHLKNLKVERQQLLPILYKGIKLNCDYRIDLLVEDEVVIEIELRATPLIIKAYGIAIGILVLNVSD